MTLLGGSGLVLYVKTKFLHRQRGVGAVILNEVRKGAGAKILQIYSIAKIFYLVGHNFLILKISV